MASKQEMQRAIASLEQRYHQVAVERNGYAASVAQLTAAVRTQAEDYARERVRLEGRCRRLRNRLRAASRPWHRRMAIRWRAIWRRASGSERAEAMAIVEATAGLPES